MRHLNPSQQNPLDFISEIVSSKKYDKEYLNMLVSKNEAEIAKYSEAFDQDCFTDDPQGVPVAIKGVEQDCEAMASLYGFKKKEIARLFVEVLSPDGHFNDICPVCGALKCTTYDHYLPRSQYQLFAVHPLNLIPCCTECNKHKSTNFMTESGSHKYWNAYLDSDVATQFLFCAITEENGMPKANFRIEQGNLDDDTFAVLYKTFHDLKLDQTYQSSAGTEIDELISSCCAYYKKNSNLGLENCFEVIADTISDKDANNWKNVLKKALITSPIFKRNVQNELNRGYRTEGKIL